MSVFQGTARHDAGDRGVGEICGIEGCIVRYSWRIGWIEKVPRETKRLLPRSYGVSAAVFVRLLQQIVLLVCIGLTFLGHIHRLRRAPVRRNPPAAAVPTRGAPMCIRNNFPTPLPAFSNRRTRSKAQLQDLDEAFTSASSLDLIPHVIPPTISAVLYILPTSLVGTYPLLHSSCSRK